MSQEKETELEVMIKYLHREIGKVLARTGNPNLVKNRKKRLEELRQELADINKL